MIFNIGIMIILMTSSVLAMDVDYEKVINTFTGTAKDYTVQEFAHHVGLIEIPSKDPKNPVPYRFFGIHESKQAKVNFPKLKKKITSTMGVDNTGAIQIIGDSSKFSEEGTTKGRIFLRAKMAKASLIEYGFTGYKSSDCKQLDINSFVNELVDEDPTVAKKVLANIVGHTPVAIKKWGTYGAPHVHNFVVVFNDYDLTKEPEYKEEKKVSGFTTFGNDITMSDQLLQANDGDTFICFEGGVQSFLQVINALEGKIPVTLVYNLRTPEKATFFSATRYLKRVADAYQTNNKLTRKEVQSIFDEYEKTLQKIWDPSKADYKTKKELFDMAMHRFIKDELYKKVTALCQFIDADTLPDKQEVEQVSE